MNFMLTFQLVILCIALPSLSNGIRPAVISQSNSIEKASSLLPGNGVNVICPDGQSECPHGNTCCMRPSGQWGCCPLPNAVCCMDNVHCCPNGYTCDVSAGTCSRLSSIPWSEKSASSLIAGNGVNSVICPGGESECPNGNTCCMQVSGQWGCCPLPNAVCCMDNVHCCPNGYTCDVSTGTCSRLSSIPWSEKSASSLIAGNGVNSVVCPGGHSECPHGNTCCMQVSGKWGCCPLPNAVCCMDNVHCCPNGYTCDLSAGTCSRLSSIPWLKKSASSLIAGNGVNSVICPDGHSECPDGNTCCIQPSGQWGCCPLPNAVCCSDHVHCCPNGYTCDVSAGTCSRLSSIPWSEKSASKKMTEHGLEKILCPDGYSICPNGYTCCQQRSGLYACCPLPNAVCCTTRDICCPSGYTCNARTGSCDGITTLPWLKKSGDSVVSERTVDSLSLNQAKKNNLGEKLYFETSEDAKQKYKE